MLSAAGVIGPLRVKRTFHSLLDCTYTMICLFAFLVISEKQERVATAKNYVPKTLIYLALCRSTEKRNICQINRMWPDTYGALKVGNAFI